MQLSSVESPNVRALVAPETILVATDRSDMEFLLPYAIAQGRASNAMLTLVSAITPGDSVPVDSPGPYIDMVKLKKEVTNEVDDQAAAIEAQGVRCQVFVDFGTAVDVICGALRKTRAQRLIMGTHGRGKLGRLTLGSVAAELLRTVQVPVFAIGPGARSHKLHETPQRILHPVSLEGSFRTGVQFAIELATANHAELTLMLVLNQSDKRDVNPERSIEWGRTALRVLLQGADALQLQTKVEAVFGKVPDEICKMAEQISADLIVIGVSGADSFSPFAETKAYKVLALAECPVMTTPHEVKIKDPVREDRSELTAVLAESGY